MELGAVVPGPRFSCTGAKTPDTETGFSEAGAPRPERLLGARTARFPVNTSGCVSLFVLGAEPKHLQETEVVFSINPKCSQEGSRGCAGQEPPAFLFYVVCILGLNGRRAVRSQGFPRIRGE